MIKTKSLNKNVILYLMVLFFVGFSTSCVRYKNLIKIKDVTGTYDISGKIELYKVQSGDLLYIKVSSFEPQSVAIFNKEYGSIQSNQLNDISIYLNSYIVSDTGTIELPVVGNVKVQELTMNEVKQVISEKISQYYKFANIDIRFLSYRISVMGEVKTPYTDKNYNEDINIFQAIGRANGITDYGNRSKIKVVRRISNGEVKIGTVNLNSDEVFASEFFYLKPNDVVYVEPLRAKAIDVNIRPWQLTISTLTFIVVVLNFLKK